MSIKYCFGNIGLGKKKLEHFFLAKNQTQKRKSMSIIVIYIIMVNRQAVEWRNYVRNCLEKGSGTELKAKDKRFVTSVINCCHCNLVLFVFQKMNHENLHLLLKSWITNMFCKKDNLTTIFEISWLSVKAILVLVDKDLENSKALQVWFCTV